MILTKKNFLEYVMEDYDGRIAIESGPCWAKFSIENQCKEIDTVTLSWCDEGYSVQVEAFGQSVIRNERTEEPPTVEDLYPIVMTYGRIETNSRAMHYGPLAPQLEEKEFKFQPVREWSEDYQIWKYDEGHCYYLEHSLGDSWFVVNQDGIVVSDFTATSVDSAREKAHCTILGFSINY